MTSTFVNGKEYKQLDKLQRLLEDMESFFIRECEYSVLPPLPDTWIKALEIYSESTDDKEKEMMFSAIVIKMIDYCRHLTAELDNQWTDKGLAKHQEFFDKYKVFWKEGERNWSQFPSL
jgi:hypothetical protein